MVRNEVSSSDTKARLKAVVGLIGWACSSFYTKRKRPKRRPLAKVPFLVTDNGSVFLSKRFRRHTGDLVSHVRTRYRTPQQLGLLERFHQTLKSEEVHWTIYQSPGDARDRLALFRDRYNAVRPHWALRPEARVDPLTPADVYVRGEAVEIPAWQSWAKEARRKLDALMEEDAGVAAA